MIGKKIQNYKIVSLLGEGGMGIVYKAFDVKLERFAALKIININTLRFSTMMERFRREARNQANLNHPNIVSVYGFVEEKNIAAIAMEYVEGETIEHILQKEGRLEAIHALDIISQVLEGISYAHGQGFIHRDLKPSNIIIDLNGNAKIMDFGISKSIDEIESVTQHNARPGTLLYMSPEQLEGHEVTIKSDLYSLGITLYEMITGVYPYKSKTFYEIVDAHVNNIPPRISDSLQSVPSEVDEIILKAMGKSFSGNFNSALDFNNAIKDLLSRIKFDVVENPKYSEDKSEIAQNASSKKSISNRVANFFLFVIFIGLAFFVYSVVKDKINQKALKDKTNSLNYSQDYSKNPNYTEQTDWQLSVINSDKNLNSIAFIDNFTGFVVGSNGLILKTTDGGQNWNEINTDITKDLFSVCLANGRIFCAGENGTLLKSGFNSQSLESINTGINENFFNLKFIDDNTGFITGSNGVILNTVDGGLTWHKTTTGEKENLFSIDFADGRTGFVVGWNGTILKTEDQGVTWHKINPNQKSYLKNILFVNQFLGFIVGGDGLVLRTDDGGAAWSKIDIGTTSGLYKIFFENNDEGMILSNRGEIFKTRDAGKTWKKFNIGKPVILNDIQKLTTGRYLIIGNNGSIFKSKIKVK
ncbi:MAG TPA: protein kinase [Ignavibacteriaceae bacterium]|nr:protein kinase [Ignavibacteriaceae bacterium]